MPGEDIYSWSTVAADNGSADTLINWVEGQTRASVNNSARSMLAAHAKNRNQITGAIVTTGSANAQAFLSGNTYTAIPLDMHVLLKVGSGLTNTGSMTLNMDGIGATLVVSPQGKNLGGGEFTSGDYVELLWNGSNWVFLYSRGFIDAALNTGLILSQRVFTTIGSTPYVPSDGMASCIIECIAGGGGGGGVYGSQSGYYMAAGGGGAGSYSRKHATAADIGAGLTVVVGAGGAGGIGSNNGSGNAGGDSSVGVICGAKGGLGGGVASNSAALGVGGGGGTPGTGDVTGVGAAGGNGGFSLTGGTASATLVASGEGGSSIFGGGAIGVTGNASAANGNNGSNYGGGGSGAGSWNQAAFDPNGGNGSAGIVIITEFAGRGAPGINGVNGATGPIGPTGPAGPGTGDVLRSGTPTAGQMAQWTDASHIQGISISPLSNVVIQKFTASGTYTPTAGMKFCIIETIGAGGGGGGTIAAGASITLAGGGGGAGGMSLKCATAAAIGASQAVTVGAGGVGASSLAGTSGGASNVGVICAANGGSGGGNSGGGGPGSQNTAGGLGGTATTLGDVLATGQAGELGVYSLNVSVMMGFSGAGGSSKYGGGGPAMSGINGGVNPGSAGSGYGSGGSGGTSTNGGAASAGGAGAPGIVIITEYI